MALQSEYENMRAGQQHGSHHELHHQQPQPHYAPVQPIVSLGLGHGSLDYVLPTTQPATTTMMAAGLYATHAMAPYS